MVLYRRYVFIFSVILVLVSWAAQTASAQETLTWQDCLKEASQNQPDLIVATENINQSKDSKTVAASGLFPQVTADARLSTAYAKGSATTKSSSYGISGDQLIFDGFKTVNQTHAASEDIKASRESFRFVSSQVRWRLRTAFIGLLKAQSFVDLTEDIYKIRKQNLQLISLRYQSGMEHRGALLTAQANLAQADFDIKSAKRAVETAQQQLIRELGREEFSPIQVQGDLTVDVDTSQPPDFSKIVQQHPNLLKAVAQKNAAGYDVKSSRSEFIPTVSISGDLGKSGNSWPPDNFGSGAGLSVSLPLFEGGARVAQLSKAKSIYRQLQASERSTKDDIVLSLRGSWNALMDAIENIDVQKKFMAASEERSNIAEAQYTVGLVSFDNWTIIEDDLVRQKKSLLDAQANALLAKANWVEAQGETLEYEK